MPKAKRQKTSTAGKELKMLLHQPVLLLMILLILATLGIFVLYPMFRVVELSFTDGEDAFTLSNLMYVLGSRSYRAVFTNSLKLAAITAFFATLVGYLFAYACTRTKMPGRRFFNTLIHLPIISPPFILALSIIFLFGRQGIITKQKQQRLRLWQPCSHPGYFLLPGRLPDADRHSFLDRYVGGGRRAQHGRIPLAYFQNRNVPPVDARRGQRISADVRAVAGGFL